MTYVITKQCVGCYDAACLSVCPVDAIDGPIAIAELVAVPAAERGKRFPGLQMFIDPDECICCGACVDECPVAAIYMKDAVPATNRDDIARNAEFFEGRKP